MIQNGAVLTYLGSWDLSIIGQSDPYFSDSDAQSEISAALSTSGIAVQSFSAAVQGTGFPWLGPIQVLLSGPRAVLDVSMQLVVQNGQGFNSPDDVLKLVRAAVQLIIGTTPSADSIPYDQEPGASPKAVTDPNCPCGFSDLFIPGGCCTVSNWFGKLETSALWLIGIILITGLAAVFLIGEGKKRILA